MQSHLENCLIYRVYFPRFKTGGTSIESDPKWVRRSMLQLELDARQEIMLFSQGFYLSYLVLDINPFLIDESTLKSFQVQIIQTIPLKMTSRKNCKIVINIEKIVFCTILMKTNLIDL